MFESISSFSHVAWYSLKTHSLHFNLGAQNTELESHGGGLLDCRPRRAGSPLPVIRCLCKAIWSAVVILFEKGCRCLLPHKEDLKRGG